MVGQIIEVTFVLIMMYLVLSNADSFWTVASAVGSTYVGAVKALQGN